MGVQGFGSIAALAAPAVVGSVFGAVTGMAIAGVRSDPDGVDGSGGVVAAAGITGGMMGLGTIAFTMTALEEAGHVATGARYLTALGGGAVGLGLGAWLGSRLVE